MPEASVRSVGARRQASRSMCVAALPTSWEPRLASWRQRPSLASSRACGAHIIREWFLDSGSTRAVVAGMDLDADLGSMERLFMAGLCGLAYGLADVVEAFRSHGVDSDSMVMGGGAGRSSLVR